jgi:hypothetical protein
VVVVRLGLDHVRGILDRPAPDPAAGVVALLEAVVVGVDLQDQFADRVVAKARGAGVRIAPLGCFGLSLMAPRSYS